MRHDFAWSLGLCAVMFSPAANAQIVKCTDAEGNVTYSDLPCLRSEKRSFVDTRAAANVMDHSFLRANKGRLLAPPPALPPVPVTYLSAPTPPPSPSTSSGTLESRATYSPF
jgi:hypothetical protein